MRLFDGLFDKVVVNGILLTVGFPMENGAKSNFISLFEASAFEKDDVIVKIKKMHEDIICVMGAVFSEKKLKRGIWQVYRNIVVSIGAEKF